MVAGRGRSKAQVAALFVQLVPLVKRWQVIRAAMRKGCVRQ